MDSAEKWATSDLQKIEERMNRGPNAHFLKEETGEKKEAGRMRKGEVETGKIPFHTEREREG